METQGWVACIAVVLSLGTGWSQVEASEHQGTQPPHSVAVVDETLTTFTPLREY